MRRAPKYCLHKPTKQAYATLDGKVVYFGKYGSTDSLDAYDVAIVEWRKRQALITQPVTVGQLCVMFLKDYAKDYFCEGELVNYQNSLKVLIRMYRTSKACEFGPRKLKAVQDEIAKDRVRKQVNICLSRIKRVFEWGVSLEIVPGQVYSDLKTVKNLKRGRSKAKEGKPVLPVPQSDIDAVLPHLTAPVQAMVRLQILTGMRPGEVLKMRAGDIEMTGDVWRYQPEAHKNSWRGKQRIISIGPRGQDVLLPFLIGLGEEVFLFNPHDGRKQFIESNYGDNAKSHVRGSENGENKPYTIHGYLSSIQKVCKRLGVEKWSPGRLRHNAATFINQELGDIDASRVVLGHSEKSTTEVYAERDLAKASEVMRKLG